MAREPLGDVIDAVEDMLAAEGVHAALRLLNARAPHRFTGVYRLEPPILRNVRLFDSENPALEVGASAPLHETYCSITGHTTAPFNTADAGADARLREHPARQSTLSYCGVPLRDEEGRAVGTLCHFDVVPRPVPESEIPVLEAVAPSILSALRASGDFPTRY
jgi:GAF domain-containing protein